MVKLSLVLDKRYRFKDNTFAIKIKLFRQNKAMYISTGYNVQENEWNKETKKIILRRDKSILNMKLSEFYNSVYEKIQNLRQEGMLRTYSNKKLYDYIVGNQDNDLENKFKTQFFLYIGKINTERTKDIYLSTYKHIEKFCGIDDLMLADITSEWLDKFCDYLLKVGCIAVNTRAIHLRNIRAILNSSKRKGLISSYVFDNYKIKREETEKRSLTIEELRILHNAELDKRQAMYRDIFFLIIYLMGINLVDLSRIKKIENGRISYRRAKTGTLYNIKVEPEAQDIIDKYKGEKHLLCVFDRYKNYNDFKRRFNENICKICNQLGIEHKVSSYWARHTFATLLYNIGVPMDTIADCLGHKSYHNQITLVYVKKNTDKIDAANRKLIDYIKEK